MSYDTFRVLAKAARTARTEATALALLRHYAESGCATYPADSKLFLELWPGGNPPGFVLQPYTLGNQSHTVQATRTCDGCGVSVPENEHCGQDGQYLCPDCYEVMA